MDKLIGRKKECEALQKMVSSNKSELVVVYGRRRIGKTFLVRQFFNDRFTFHFTGLHNVNTKVQLQAFASSLQRHNHYSLPPTPGNWHEAFQHLEDMIARMPTKKRKIIFLDEMPWMDTPKSGFVAALEAFWNSWAALRDDILLVACGSATSWMVKKLLRNQGGLFNRVTGQIYLQPFNLSETEEYLTSRGCSWDRFQIVQCYMTLGGVPFYLSLLDPRNSLTQNIDELFFSSINAPLRNEINELYHSLFHNPLPYLEVVRLLAGKREGFTRSEISEKTHLQGATLTMILDDLERCDFIVGYQKYGSKVKNILYRVIDFYTLFHHHFADNNRGKDPHYWQHLIGKPQQTSWQGFSFELVCLLHLSQIKQALGIAGISTQACCWRSADKTTNYQIDLLIDRADRIINLCEMKFSNTPYVMTKNYADLLRTRMAAFAAESKTRKGLVVTMVTTYGVAPGKNNGVVSNEVLMDDLFRKEP